MWFVAACENVEGCAEVMGLQMQISKLDATPEKFPANENRKKKIEKVNKAMITKSNRLISR